MYFVRNDIAPRQLLASEVLCENICFEVRSPPERRYLLLFSPITLILLRSRGGATEMLKGLLGMGSPPWHTVMATVPYKERERERERERDICKDVSGDWRRQFNSSVRKKQYIFKVTASKRGGIPVSPYVLPVERRSSGRCRSSRGCR